jgi:DNA-binding MarR family transcriptional regulator
MVAPPKPFGRSDQHSDHDPIMTNPKIAPKLSAPKNVAPRGSAEADLKLEEFLPYRLNVVSSLASHALSSIYAKQYGIDIPEWRVLVTLGQYGEMTGKAVGEHSHMHKTKVSRAVATLEKRRYVARKVNRDDLREGLLSLTPSGRATFEKLVPIALDFVSRLVETLDATEKAALDRALRKIRERSHALSKEIDGEIYRR